MCSMIYNLWRARNLRVFQSKSLTPMEVAKMAEDLVFDFNKWNPEVCIKNRIPECNDNKVQGVCIIQVDASVFEEGCISFGCIIKDEDIIVLSACKVEAMNVEVAMAETLAIRWSLNLARSKNIEKVLVQSDCLSAVDCINCFSNIAVLEPIAADCRNLCNSFNCAFVVFIPRSQNFVAHNLARCGYREGDCMWEGETPALFVSDPPFN
ncbi:uncharacterized protein LOC131636630 [Vicia villosa]|uniref:uncharacterized protein LOC131636630 n=1 Tax=Vicia villosa TaxID=3911 RepID=UPI00273CD35B|nr:uncharacterized protein LOC131636630 [Vicia villosa]